MDFYEFEGFVRDSFPEVTDDQMEKFRLMEGGYREWNARINVVSRKDIDGLYAHHVLHSLAIAEYLKVRRPEDYSRFTVPSDGNGCLKVLDLGTGGGFPGIPLAVLFPCVHFTLYDSVGKKTVVAREISSLLELRNVNVVNARAESLDESFDFVVSRAVASLTDFYPWVKGKYADSILYLKGGDVASEIGEMMGRFRRPRGSVSTWAVGNWIPDAYFDGKFVIDIR